MPSGRASQSSLRRRRRRRSKRRRHCFHCIHPFPFPQKMDFSIAEIYDWFVENYQRPLLILTCGMLLFNLPTLIYKLQLAIQGILYFFFCNDKTWKKPQDPASIFAPVLSSGGNVGRKTIYFVRHGESTWNDTFNKGQHRSALVFAIGFIPGLFKAVMYEIYLILSGKIDRYACVWM